MNLKDVLIKKKADKPIKTPKQTQQNKRSKKRMTNQNTRGTNVIISSGKYFNN